MSRSATELGDLTGAGVVGNSVQELPVERFLVELVRYLVGVLAPDRVARRSHLVAIKRHFRSAAPMFFGGVVAGVRTTEDPHRVIRLGICRVREAKAATWLLGANRFRCRHSRVEVVEPVTKLLTMRDVKDHPAADPEFVPVLKGQTRVSLLRRENSYALEIDEQIGHTKTSIILLGGYSRQPVISLVLEFPDSVVHGPRHDRLFQGRRTIYRFADENRRK